MSPEQAKGTPADKRSDVWAFGCVLYEMLTGRRAFDGEDTTEVLGAVVRLEPDWHALPSDLPQPVRTLLLACLVKDRRHRVADISTARFVLDQLANLDGPADADRGGGTAGTHPRCGVARSRRLPRPSLPALRSGRSCGWRRVRGAPRVTRFTVTPTGAAALALDPPSRDLDDPA